MKIPFRLILLLSLYFSAQSLWAQTADADKITGVWLNQDKDKKFEVYKTKSNSYEAKVVWVKEGSDAKPVGSVIFKDLRYKSKGLYADGKVYAAQSNEWVKCKAELKDSKTLIFTGIKGMFSRSQTWTKQ